MTTPWSQLLVAFLLVAIGFVAGVLVTYWWFFREGQKEDKVENPEPTKKVKMETPGSSLVDQRMQSVIAPPPAPTLSKKLEQKSALIEAADQPLEVQKKIIEPISIVSQIDEILQEMILKKGMGARGIQLREDSRQGVLVWIGLDRFVGIDAVPDVDVRSIIREAVSVWEQRAAKK
jgi:hypothetical protein